MDLETAAGEAGDDLAHRPLDRDQRRHREVVDRGHRRLDEAGIDEEDAQPARRQVEVQGTGEIIERGLARAVEQRARQRPVAGDAADEGQRARAPASAVALAQQARHQRRGEMHGAAQVDVERGIDACAVEFGRAHRVPGAGGVDRHVDALPEFIELACRRFEGGRVGGVAGQGERSGQFGGDPIEQLAAPRRQRHPRATRRQLARQRLADARRGADDPDAQALPVGDARVHGRLRKESVTSPRVKPYLLITERLSMTWSSMRNIQSSKSTSTVLPSTGSAST